MISPVSWYPVNRDPKRHSSVPSALTKHVPPEVQCDYWWKQCGFSKEVCFDLHLYQCHPPCLAFLERNVALTQTCVLPLSLYHAINYLLLYVPFSFHWMNIDWISFIHALLNWNVFSGVIWNRTETAPPYPDSASFVTVFSVLRFNSKATQDAFYMGLVDLGPQHTIHYLWPSIGKLQVGR